MSGTTTARRGPYGKTAARRTAILDAALDVFGQQGYRTGSLREVAARVRLSEAGVLHHFTSKADLLIAVLEHRDALAERAFPPAGEDGTAALRRLLDLARHNATTPGVVELFTVLAAEATAPDHPAHAFFARRLASVRHALTEAFADLDRRGLLRPGVEVPVAVTTTVAVWNGLQLQWLMAPSLVDVPRDLRAHLAHLVTADLDATDLRYRQSQSSQEHT